MIPLDIEVLRPKVRACIDGYLRVSDNYSLTLGLYRRGRIYIYKSSAPDGGLLYDVGSVSKTMTAHLILSLRDKGLLDISKSISDYIDLPNGDYPTLYRLLTHTAGYGYLTPVEITLPSLIKHGFAKRNVYEGCTAGDVISCLKRRTRKRKASYGYSDFAYAILAVIAERVSGRPFAELIEDFVQNELGMTDTHISLNGEKRYPPGAHKGKIYGYWRWNRDNPYVAAGGMVSNIEDIMRYLALQIASDEKYITDAHELCPESLSAPGSSASCIGWHTYKRSDRLWQVGAAGSFRSSVIFNKKREIAVAVLGNATGIRSANVHYLAKMLYGEMKCNKIKL